MDLRPPLLKYDLIKKQTTNHIMHNSDLCAVCLQKDFIDTVLLPCYHSFHGVCILQWVEANFSCPLCRRAVEQFLPIEDGHQILQFDPNGPLSIEQYTEKFQSERIQSMEIFSKFVEIWESHYLRENRAIVSSIKDDTDLLVQTVLAENITSHTSEPQTVPILAKNYISSQCLKPNDFNYILDIHDDPIAPSYSGSDSRYSSPLRQSRSSSIISSSNMYEQFQPENNIMPLRSIRSFPSFQRMSDSTDEKMFEPPSTYLDIHQSAHKHDNINCNKIVRNRRIPFLNMAGANPTQFDLSNSNVNNNDFIDIYSGNDRRSDPFRTEPPSYRISSVVNDSQQYHQISPNQNYPQRINSAVVHQNDLYYSKSEKQDYKIKDIPCPIKIHDNIKEAELHRIKIRKPMTPINENEEIPYKNHSPLQSSLNHSFLHLNQCDVYSELEESFLPPISTEKE